MGMVWGPLGMVWGPLGIIWGPMGMVRTFKQFQNSAVGILIRSQHGHLR